MGVEINVAWGDAQRRSRDPLVLELRVHGVNNTTPADLLDLPAGDVALVAGDKLGSFWAPTSAQGVKTQTDAAATRGVVPPGISREAYSWGGMVRTTPNFGGVGAAGIVAGVAARVLYALLLPFSLGNAVEWTRRLTTAGERRATAALTAGLARLFGLTLTLLFTTTAVTLALDVVGGQCAEQPGLCAPIQWLLDPLATWTTAQRLALFSLGPLAAVGVLLFVSALSRQRYDVLPGMADHRDTRMGLAPTPDGRPPSAVLSQPGFWSNRITASLARAHIACATLLTTGLVAQDAAVRGTGTGVDAVIAIAAAVLLLAGVVLVCVLPTMALPPTDERATRWPGVASGALLGLALATFAVLFVLLVFFTGADALTAAPGGRGLYGAGFVPLVLIGVGAVLALSGVLWRPWRGRRATAWAGCGPAVLMAISLAVAVAASAIVVVTAGDLLNGAAGASDLIRDHSVTTAALRVPSVWVGAGAAILVAALVGLVLVLTALVVPRSVAARARLWRAPWRRGDEIVPIGAGVMPLSQGVLFDRIAAKRRSAALMHLVEPAAGILAVLLGAGLVLGWVWTGIAYAQDASLWAVLLAPGPVVRDALDAAMWGLGATGLLLVAVLASGATSKSPRPLGIVWDIACFLPRTGQPFGPPCFAQRAVPEIAGRMFAWLEKDDRRRVVLMAHSMGAVLAVASLGLLASSPDTRRMLARIRLLTFGVQLRAYFGRMLPELLGPDVLGTRPSRGPGFYRRDPWAKDAAAQRAAGAMPEDGGQRAAGAMPDATPVDRIGGTLLADSALRWVNLWRLTDMLGFPALSGAPQSTDGTFRNGIDRYAHEIDTTGYMVEVGTHSAYFRQPEYDIALRELADLDG